ncbi:MAG TPA: 3-hydroxybutyryl-CoA dehydrogenase, partial [Syntrophomonas wolfei]|nr:3-hydroxybutyryl-CoA dehydrogenase [Syntrophomonas wolfei]
GLATTDEVYKIIEEASIKMGKIPVWCKDVPGFVSNRVLQVMINEALWELYEGVAPAENIDNIMKLGMNHPMGPCELADLIGLDTILSILNVMYTGYGDPKYRPSPLLKQYVQAGWLGRKTGKGIYDYRK